MKKLLTLAALMATAGCTDPFSWKDGYWDAQQVNLSNMAVQAADWHDVARGHGDPGSDGREAAAAVARLRSGNLKSLPDMETSSVSTGSSSGGSGGTTANGAE